MSTFGLWVRPDADGFYRHVRGELIGEPFPSRDEAEEVRRAMPNGAEFEVMEADE